MMTFTVGTGKVHSLAFAPAGDRLAVGTGACCVHLVGWPETDNRAELRRLQSGGAVAKHLAFDPPGTRIAAMFSDGHIVEWPAEMTPAVRAPLANRKGFQKSLGVWHDAHRGWVRAGFHGGYVLADEKVFVQIPWYRVLDWDLRRSGHFAGFDQVWDAADGRIISREGHEFSIWEYPPPPEPPPPEPPRSAWSRLAKLVRDAWATPPAVELPKLTQVDRFPLGGGPWVCAARPDAATVVLADRKHFLRRLDWRTGAELACWRFPLDVIHSLAVSPDGTVAAAGSNRGRVLVWDLE